MGGGSAVNLQVACHTQLKVKIFRADMKLFMIFAAVIAAMYRFKLRHTAKYSKREEEEGEEKEEAHLNGTLGGDGRC